VLLYSLGALKSAFTRGQWLRSYWQPPSRFTLKEVKASLERLAHMISHLEERVPQGGWRKRAKWCGGVRALPNHTIPNWVKAKKEGELKERLVPVVPLEGRARAKR